ncbi:hypothetical protein [Leptolyngbya sp. FACHB-261]|uniref:hypothetical protein n=1 Tax=Leptolyngbya sp. FACHB-261 TaxID=2692806 RepID=UPI001685AC87|nr:hypothetical protein [Leptolyngbya sp. FACHB-261]MBD2101913.1 hypothetical protein [Leptolyngbya sp. FACHB-261]
MNLSSEQSKPDLQSPPSPPDIDLNEVASAQNLTVEIKSAEHPLVMQARLTREVTDAWFGRLREFLLFVSVLSGVGVIIGFVCLPILNNPKASADDKKWATSTLTLIVSGGVGYLTGKNSSTKGD